MDALTFREVREILDLIDQSSAAEVTLEVAGTQLHVKRRGARGREAVPQPSLDVAPTPATPTPAPAPTHTPAPQSVSSTGPEGCVAVRAPLAGIFYRAPSPDAPPFVEVGQQVTANTDVCIIEVMKVMNNVKAGVAGAVVEVVGQNEAPVEYQAPIVWIRPS